ncbi:GNAT family protein [Bacillus smithii]|uniref:GNAT family N-acetyltransferase n=1 Tax=Bacillus smithii TaxID=1479 RepID=UPI002E1CE97E|nr:GNAT family protein [Bacillus smithii]MED1457479.1 GNAT family protein [Bacillus smithii]
MLRLPIDDQTYLKLLEEQDAEPLFNLTDSCRTYLREWLPWVDSTKAVEDTISFIESSKKKSASKNGMDAGIWYNGQLAGIIGLHFIDWTNKKTSIGYWLGEPFQGRGLMTKACIAMIHHIFNDLQLNRVEIRCAVLNSKSRAIPERLGFSKEGTIREAEWLYDHFVDHIVYSMLAREWKTQEKDPFKQSII